MKIAQVVIYSIIVIIISSCATNKAVKYLKEGKTSEENFKVTLPFELRNGFIIVQAKIKNKDYNFILDTGTPNLVSKELAKSLNLKVIDSVKASDVFNKKQTNQYARINSIKIGTLDFVGTAALINDFNSVAVWSDMNVDGFIGSNLMQHAIWDIDFNKKQITITDNEAKLSLPEEIVENKLFIGYAGIPAVACKINGKKVWNFTVDFGYNGGIVMPFSEFEKQKENGQISDFTKSNTHGIVGIYGKQDITRASYRGIINEIEFGNSTLKKEKVYSEQYFNQLFGLEFFRNYRVILNWKSKKIKLIENTENTHLE
ncbi:retropepsin-like aspartic protease [Bizionia sp.]|uniref:retropepsin-like aspartic protease n=1 Tax=Bizionia sp. TaxID=1954480 RepID=UPI003A9164F5